VIKDRISIQETIKSSEKTVTMMKQLDMI